MNNNQPILFLQKYIFVLLLGTSWYFTGCIPYEEEKITEVQLDYRDSTARKIFDFQDRGELDSLYTYFYDANPTYRYLAARAFGSLKDKKALNNLGILLNDNVDETRAAAAFAIGQIGDSSAIKILTAAFEISDTAGIYGMANGAILEAVGKCGTPSDLANITGISTYFSTDTLLVNGQASAIYRFALKDITSALGTKTMLGFLNDKKITNTARLTAANYLFRAKNIVIDKEESMKLISIFNNEKDPNIKMGIAIGIGKSKTLEAKNALLSALATTKDYRVQCNIISALRNFSYEDVKSGVNAMLSNSNIHVSTRAADFFIAHGKPSDALSYWTLAKTNLPWQIQIKLYQAANRHLEVYLETQRNEINAELRYRFLNTNAPYQRIAILKALGEFSWNYRYVHREALKDSSFLVKVTGIEIINYISTRDNFTAVFKGSRNYIAREIARMYQEDIESGDPGLMYTAANAILGDSLGFKAIYGENIQFLQDALDKMTLPREIEAYNEVLKVVGYLKETPTKPKQVDYNHPIDWVYLDIVGANPTTIIKTTKGDITMQLLPNEAPGTVSNFIQLAKANFFDQKNFHRVISNFVAQGGCTRGDGYGAPNYTVRSEFTMINYDRPGRVGMASAGNNTESAQFFITHSPTPFLNGNYTIFAQVIKGMDVVHKIEPGDIIISATIQ